MGRPQPPDFSPRAVSRAVLRDTLQKPHVLYPTAIGILGGAAALLLGPATIFVVPALVGSVVGAGAWALDYGLRKDKHAAEYLKRMQEQLAGRIAGIAASLASELRELGHDRAQEQLGRLQGKFDACEDLLRRKFNPGEMTFSRYLGMTEQVFLAGLDNLRQIADTLRGVNAIEEPRLVARAAQIEKRGAESPAAKQELSAIHDSLALLQRQRAKIQEWLAENEAAMNQMDRVMAAIADMDTAQDHAQMDMGPAMQELRGLLERAHNYIRNDPPEGKG